MGISFWDKPQVSMEDLVGRIITAIEIPDSKEEATIHMADGGEYYMYHEQDCCEQVSIEDISGDIADVLGTPVLDSYESTNVSRPALSEWDDSHTWTFYHIRTIKGSITIRWYGTSNGYYSESVSLIEIRKPNKPTWRV